MRAKTCGYGGCNRLAIYTERGWPAGGWLPRWVAKRLATPHHACGRPEHLAAAHGAAERARRR